MNDYIFVNEKNLENVCMNYITKKVPFYDYIFDFHEDLAIVRNNFQYGYINKKGNIEIPIIYDYAYDFSNGTAKVYKNKKTFYIDKYGKITEKKNDKNEIQEKKLIKYCNNQKWGFINKKGIIVINNKYDNVQDFSENLAAVEINRKWGYIDKNGKEIIPCIYNSTMKFSENLAVVEKNSRYGYINKDGKLAIPFMYDSAYSFSEGVAIAKKDNELILIYNQIKLNKELEEKLQKILFVFPNGFYYNPVTNEINLNIPNELINEKQKIK